MGIAWYTYVKVVYRLQGKALLYTYIHTYAAKAKAMVGIGNTYIQGWGRQVYIIYILLQYIHTYAKGYTIQATSIHIQLLLWVAKAKAIYAMGKLQWGKARHGRKAGARLKVAVATVKGKARQGACYKGTKGCCMAVRLRYRRALVKQ